MRVKVAVPVPARKLFTYLVPAQLREEIEPGQRVEVPFGSRILTGLVLEPSSKKVGRRLKYVRRCLDLKPVLSPSLLKLGQWISRYYLSPPGETFKAMLPSGLLAASENRVALTAQGILATKDLEKRERDSGEEILRFLYPSRQVGVSSLKKRFDFPAFNSVLAELESQGLVNLLPSVSTLMGAKLERTVCLPGFLQLGRGDLTFKALVEVFEERAPAQARCLKLLHQRGRLKLGELLKLAATDRETLNRLVRQRLVEIESTEAIRDPLESYEAYPLKASELNSEQKSALAEVSSALRQGQSRTFLLFGVTGSGKTQIYIEAVKLCLKLGKSSLILIPEISLTPQTVGRFKAGFGERVGVWHSRLSSGERYDTWRRARQGELDVVVGVRSAIFSPLPNLGLVVIDEEHDSSYKQESPNPKYNAREVALMRAKLEKAVTILGSATPSFESYQNALAGKYALLRLSFRVEARPLPKVEIVDMTTSPREPGTLLGGELFAKIKKALSTSRQIILLHNRRGFSLTAKCQDCGFVWRCPNCDISLTYHRQDLKLLCHYCDFHLPAPQVCDNCEGTKIFYRGYGTQRIEGEVKRCFPESKLVRMDFDATRRKGAHQSILDEFRSGRANLLLGTQMVSKGLDFPEVVLVGVLSADLSLDFPDFRAGERTFQLLTQVSGRCGRGQLPGEVVVQTYHPDNAAVVAAVSQDFESFFSQEVATRRKLFYPPFSHLILVRFSGKKESELKKGAEVFHRQLSQKLSELAERVRILGPVSSLIPRLRGEYRYQILIKVKRILPIIEVLDQLLESESIRKLRRRVKVSIDVDPQEVF
ncbi:MAG: primosomal protein N' [Candidatus Zixiibacteriota bacterium]